MTDAEILATMRAKKDEADRLKAKVDAITTEQAALFEKERTLWQEIHRLHNALLHPDPTL